MRWVALAVAAALPSTAAANTDVAAVDRPTTLSAEGSTLIFSKRDDTGRFRLWVALGARVPAVLGVPAREVPFDADLGRGPRGQLLAVYSRCDSEPNFRYDDLQGSLDWTGGKSCDRYGRGAPSWEGSRLYWARLCQGDPAGCGGRTGLMRTGPRGPQRAKLRADDTWQARGDGVTYILRDTDQWHGCFDPESVTNKPTCTIVATTPRYR